MSKLNTKFYNDINQLIKYLIKNIIKNSQMDAHKIINEFIKQFPKTYRNNRKKYKTDSTFHSQISKYIDKILKTGNPKIIKSKNINGKNTKNKNYKLIYK